MEAAPAPTQRIEAGAHGWGGDVQMWSDPDPEMHYVVVEDNTVRNDGILSDYGFVCILPDTADKKLLGGLPLIKVGMRLITAIHDTGFALVDDLIYKGTFTFFAVGKVYLPRNTPVDIETNMGLGFL